VPLERRVLGYQPALDGLRAVAITLVVCFHFFGLAGGYLGVDLFFVLSGFLITTLLLEERARHPSISFSRFYLRRALRLFPALWVFLAASLVIYAALGSGLRGQLKAMLLGVTYTTNLGVITGHWDGRFGHLWSLAVEEQFYLAWPLVLVLVLRTGRVSLRSFGLATAAAAMLLMLARLAAMPDHVPVRIGTASVTRFDSILLGCAVGLLLASGAGASLRRLACSAPVAAVALGICAWLVVTASGTRTVYDGLTYLFSFAFAFLLVAVVRHEDSPRWTGWLRRPLTLLPVVFLGRISYAVYLWHLGVMIWFDHERLPARIGPGLTHLIEIGLTLAAATASYYLVERYFLRRKWQLSRTPSHDADAPTTLVHPRAEPSEVAVVRQ
jgi:peptidoglycan/LPS O-acetylase OafA/YrhL